MYSRSVLLTVSTYSYSSDPLLVAHCTVGLSYWQYQHTITPLTHCQLHSLQSVCPIESISIQLLLLPTVSCTVNFRSVLLTVSAYIYSSDLLSVALVYTRSVLLTVSAYSYSCDLLSVAHMYSRSVLLTISAYSYSSDQLSVEHVHSRSVLLTVSAYSYSSDQLSVAHVYSRSVLLTVSAYSYSSDLLSVAQCTVTLPYSQYQHTVRSQPTAACLLVKNADCLATAF